MEGGVCKLDGRPIGEYIFKENYYYTGGDNVSDSKDSRYWGFMPEEFIIGVATRISYFRDRHTDKFRWDRLWKKIE
jgi:signal peptidase I